jgi:hypothetical protein
LNAGRILIEEKSCIGRTGVGRRGRVAPLVSHRLSTLSEALSLRSLPCLLTGFPSLLPLASQLLHKRLKFLVAHPSDSEQRIHAGHLAGPLG